MRFWPGKPNKTHNNPGEKSHYALFYVCGAENDLGLYYLNYTVIMKKSIKFNLWQDG